MSNNYYFHKACGAILLGGRDICEYLCHQIIYIDEDEEKDSSIPYGHAGHIFNGECKNRRNEYVDR